MKIFKRSNISKKFLIAASAYRRNASDRSLDFSLDSLIAQYRHETYGEKRPDPKINGYTCGKWIMDANLKAMREDHQDGLFTKHELMRGTPAAMRRVIAKFPPAEFFGYRG